MSDHCCSPPAATPDTTPHYRRVLWIALWLNLAMFGLEMIAGATAQSLALLVDALDFFGDACNFAVGLYLIKKPLRVRAKFSLLKAAVMGIFALIILSQCLMRLWSPVVPVHETMGIVGGLALFTNVAVAILLLNHRGGDSNRRSIWLCTRNDAIGNVLVVLAAIAVSFTGSGWPDSLVAMIMALLGLHAAWQVVQHARQELRISSKLI